MHRQQRHVFRSLALKLFGLLLLALLAVVPGLPAQQTGTITGRVTQSGSGGQPVGSVQIFIGGGLDIGVLTQQNGRYLLQNVPAGTHTLSAQRIGYRSQTAEVTVDAGETVVHNFQISEEALQLDEVIVTGTPGGTQRRAIGNAVTRFDAAEVAESRPVHTMQEMLQGRSPGVEFTRSSGNIGEGSSIRIRGVSSLSLGTQPLIYIDGVRMDNKTDLGPKLANTSRTRGTSALDDLNPNDIASIEIIKGPAAATLYGTEASAGVIQIITKQGETGAPQIDVTVSQGTNFLMDPAGRIGDQWGKDPDTGELYSFRLIEEEKAKGFEPLGYGWNQGYNVGVRGGSDVVTYYASVDVNSREGVVDYNWSDRISGRVNLGILFSEQLDLDLSMGYINGENRYAHGSQEQGGLWNQTMWARGANLDTPLRGYLQNTPEQLATVEATRDYNRFTGSATLNHNPTEWFSHSLIMGLDRGQEESQVLYPRHPDGADGPFTTLSLGDITVERPINTEITVDYSASANYSLNDAIGLTSSVGAQFYSTEFNRIENNGRIFPSPVIRSVGGATSTQSGHTFFQNKSLGVYYQQEASLNDRVFLTAAVRGDDNSAFGSEFDAAIYPKFSGTWVVSEEPFWDLGFVNSLRLRTAWGQAGRQPSTFAAVTLMDPSVGPGGVPSVTPGTRGNDEVGPEVSSELELGFDAAFLDDRISTEFTYYNQQTKDALTSLPLAPSNGFPGSTDFNIGRLDTWGYEIAVQARAFEQQNWDLDFGLSVAYTMNEIKDLGGRAQTRSFREGFPYPAVTSDIVVSGEFDPVTGEPTNLMCDAGTADLRRGGEIVPCADTEAYDLLLGPGFAPWTFSLNTTLTLFDNLQVFGMMDGQQGAWFNNFNLTCRHTFCFYNTRASLLLDDPLYVESTILRHRHPLDRRVMFDMKSGYLKLREIGARYQIPEGWISVLGGERGSISVTGRDLWYLWRAQEYMSGAHIPTPESMTPQRETFSIWQWPPLTSFEATVRMSF